MDEAEAINRAAGTYDDVDDVLDRPDEDYELALTFSGEAGETFDDLIRTRRFAQFSVDLYPEDGGEKVEGILYGLAHDSDWYGTVEYREHDGYWEPVGELKEMRVRRIHIH